MNRLEFGNVLGPSDLGGSRSLPATGGLKAYDDLAGSTLLRRTGKSAAMGAPRRSSKASTLVAARRKSDADDTLNRQLRDFYQTMLREPAPEKLVALVDALAAQAR